MPSISREQRWLGWTPLRSIVWLTQRENSSGGGVQGDRRDQQAEPIVGGGREGSRGQDEGSQEIEE